MLYEIATAWFWGVWLMGFIVNAVVAGGATYVLIDEQRRAKFSRMLHLAKMISDSYTTKPRSNQEEFDEKKAEYAVEKVMRMSPPPPPSPPPNPLSEKSKEE